MNELIRMQYLDAMGIETYVPRRLLPAAKLSVKCNLPVKFAAPLVSEQKVSVAQAPAELSLLSPLTVGASGFVESILKVQHNNRSKTKPTDDSEITLQQFIAPKSHKSLRFNLLVWQLANGTVFIDSHEPKAALPTATLLNNIVRVIYPDQVLPKYDIIQWPLFNSKTSTENELLAARDMAQAFLGSRFDAVKPSLLVVMGRLAKNIILDTGPEMIDDDAVYGLQQSIGSLPCSHVVLPSLSQLLREPLLKRHIWSALIQSAGFIKTA
jgi:hypothetical protein